MDSAAEPVSVIISRKVREGSEAAFEATVKDWIPKATAFPGHMGVFMLRPPPGGREYGALLKFRSQADWEAFQRWPDYLHWLADIQPLLESSPEVESLSGLEGWFTPLGAQVTRVPPRWKQAVVTWLGVCAMGLVLTFGYAPLAAELPWVVGFLVGNAIAVAGLTWVVMPALSRLFRPWLVPVHEARTAVAAPVAKTVA